MKHYEFLTGDRTRDQRNVDMLLGAVEQLWGRSDLDQIVRGAVDGAILVTGAQRGVLLLADEKGELSVRVARHKDGRELPKDLRYSRSVAGKVWTTGKPHLAVDADAGGALALGRSILDLRLLSILAVPLRARDRSIGVLYVDSTATSKEFTEGDRALFEALAGLVATALEQGRLALEEAEKKRLQGEVDVAKRIQQSLAPKGVVPPKGYDLAYEGRAAVETSGDYHDVIPLTGGRLALVIGDVSGHGLGAALFMASVRALLRTLLHTSPDPAPAFLGLNSYLCRDMPSDSFMSLFVGVLDPAARTFSWVCAGHNPPIHFRRGKDLAELQRTGPVLGVLPDAPYRVAGPLPLEAGDAIVLFTDGLTEAKSPQGDIWTDERFHASLAAHAGKDPTAKGLLSGLLADVNTWVAGRPMDDDLTCVVVRVLDDGGAGGAAGSAAPGAAGA